MNFRRLAIADVILIQTDIHEDDRGSFMETWHSEKYQEIGVDVSFVQVNQSFSKLGVLRGLHYQVKRPQGKLVHVMFGEIFDVAVDLRRSSATFGGWIGERLSAENRSQLWVPPGFAHGFISLSEKTQVLYMCTDYYAPQHERTLLWSDPALAINWPKPGDAPLTLSQKDASGVLLSQADLFE